MRREALKMMDATTTAGSAPVTGPRGPPTCAKIKNKSAKCGIILGDAEALNLQDYVRAAV